MSLKIGNKIQICRPLAGYMNRELLLLNPESQWEIIELSASRFHDYSAIVRHADFDNLVSIKLNKSDFYVL